MTIFHYDCLQFLARILLKKLLIVLKLTVKNQKQKKKTSDQILFHLTVRKM